MARITRVEVTGLLDYFNHTVKFPADWHYILLYGPNGIGKTRLLELVYAVYSQSFDEVLGIPFESLKLTHDDGNILTVTRESSAEGSLVFLSLKTPSGTQKTGRYASTGTDRIRKYLISNTTWRPITGGRWQDSMDGEITDFGEVVARYYGPIGGAQSHLETDLDIDPCIDELLADTPVHFIATQRLLYEDQNIRMTRHRESMRRPTIEAYTENIKTKLAKALAENSRRTQQLDRSFPRRLLEHNAPDNINADIIRDRYAEQSEKRSALTALGLINSDVDVPLPQRNLNTWELHVLKTYLDDTDEKLRTFDDVAARVTLFRDIANTRFFNKTLRVNVQEGIVVTRDADGRPIPPAGLSSGEQHELILMYDLLFNVPQGALVLIDEPEISLHVAWQKSFVADIDRIAELASLRFVIATHSPQIINKAWDRTSELGPKIASEPE